MKTFLPQDARCLDIVSALSMLGVAIEIATFEASGFITMRPIPFWVVVLTIFSVLHLISIYVHPVAETLRATLSSISGLFWVFLFLDTISPDRLMPIIFFLGVGCLYSAGLTILYIGQKWKS